MRQKHSGFALFVRFKRTKKLTIYIKMQKNEDEMLAEAYGLLARGYKKLRQTHLIRSRLSSPGRGSPQTSESDESSDTEIGTSGPDSENTTPPQSSLFPHIDFLCKARSGAWGNAFLKHALDPARFAQIVSKTSGLQTHPSAAGGGL